MFLKKRRTLILILVVLIAVAIYLNVSYSENGGLFDITETASTQKTLGEATLVDNNVTTADNADGNYFAQSRLSRSKTRDESIALLKSIVDNQNSSAEQKTKATDDLSYISEIQTKENTIENLIKAKGFSDCIAFISNEGITVTIKSDGILPNQAAQIKDIVIRELKITADKINITEVK